MLISKKIKYAIRAVFEIAKRQQDGPVKAAEIADAQKIPVRFLEVILNRLKHCGIVNAKRGYQGGYTLARSPENISVGDILRQMESDQSRLHCVSCLSKNDCELIGDCAFLPMWEKAQKSMLSVFDQTSIQNLIDQEQARM
jgi:Rrf2 family protein